jgi:hypothetical protein
LRPTSLLCLRLLPVIAHPQLQRHGALNRASANDETKRVSAPVMKHPRHHRQMVALGCDRAPCGAVVRRPGRAWDRLGEPRSKPHSFWRGLVNRPSRWVLRAPSAWRRSLPGRDASRGSGERFVDEPVPPGPEALFTFGRGPVFASRRRPAAEHALRCRSCSTERPGWAPSAFCLHNQDACTNLTVTHSAGQ